MTESVQILAIPGSMREGSYNKALLVAAAELAPEGVTVELATIRGIPVYDGDLEAREGIPAEVDALKARVVAADALLIASPEYNNSIPGPMKNAIDWLSRPPADIGRVFGGRVVGLIGATPGRGGTRLAQAAWLPIFRTLGVHAYFGGSFYLDSAGERVKEGKLIDAKSRELLARYVAGLADFARRAR